MCAEAGCLLVVQEFLKALMMRKSEESFRRGLRKLVFNVRRTAWICFYAIPIMRADGGVGRAGGRQIGFTCYDETNWMRNRN